MTDDVLPNDTARTQWDAIGLALDRARRPRGELRSYDRPWYERVPDAVTDYAYGPNATAQQQAWARKLTGPENPLNFPAQIHHGIDTAATGYRVGSPSMAGAGALEAVLGGALVGLPAAAGLRSGVRTLREGRAARDAAEAAKGPWGNPGMLDEVLDRPLQPARHELNLPRFRQDIEASEGMPHSPFRKGRDFVDLTDAEKAANGDHWNRLDLARKQYGEVGGPEHSYGRDVHESIVNRPQRSTQELNAEYQALIDEGRNFVRPQAPEIIGDVHYSPWRTDRYGEPQATGKLETRGPPGRWSHSDTPDEEYLKAYHKDESTRSWEERAHRDYGAPKPVTPMEALAADIRRHAANNENIPGFYDKGDALAQRLEGLQAQQKPNRDANWAEIQNWWNTTGSHYNRKLFKDFEKANPELGDVQTIGPYQRHGYRHHDDTNEFYGNKPGTFDRPNPVDRGDAFTIDTEDLQRILVNEFGANPRDRDSMERAYQAFWADEKARRAAGKMTRHQEEERLLKLSNDNFVREHFGLDPDNPAHAPLIKQASDEYFGALRGDVQRAREGAEERMGLRQRATGLKDVAASVGNNVLRYGPPTAVGAYAANKMLDRAYPPPPNASPSDIGVEAGARAADGATRPRPEQKPQQSAPPDPTDMQLLLQRNRDDAANDKWQAGLRLGVHSTFGPAGVFGMPGKLGKTGWGALQAAMAAGAYGDRQRAERNRDFWDSMLEGYRTLPPNLDQTPAD